MTASPPAVSSRPAAMPVGRTGPWCGAVRWGHVGAGLAQCASLAGLPADAPAPAGATGGDRPRPRHPGGDLRERPRGSHRPEFVHRLPHAGPARGARAGYPCAPGARRADVPRGHRRRSRPPGVPDLRCSDRGSARCGCRGGRAAGRRARLPGRRGPLRDLWTVRGVRLGGDGWGARMSQRLTTARRVAELLPALDAAFPTDLLPVVRGFLATTTGATTVDILMADYDLLVLRRLQVDMTGGVIETMPVDDSPAGRAFITQDSITEVTDDAVHVHLPISVRAERLGVLDVVLREPPAADVLDTLEPAGDRALVPAAGCAQGHRHRGAGPARAAAGAAGGDAVADAVDPGVQLRSVQLSLAGQLVPAYEVGGDLFDYAVGTDELFVLVIDAMGHGLRASLLRTLAVTAPRNARRTGLALADQLRQADRVLHPQFGGGAVRHRALAVRIDLATGSAEVVLTPGTRRRTCFATAPSRLWTCRPTCRWDVRRQPVRRMPGAVAPRRPVGAGQRRLGRGDRSG